MFALDQRYQLEDSFELTLNCWQFWLKLIAIKGATVVGNG
jgi:hypothetical protein